MSIHYIFIIGAGGFLGAIFRYLVAIQMAKWLGAGFPYGTLTVNAIGSFLLGFLARFFLIHSEINELVRIAITIGFLGAFTTFSTFSYESMILLEEGELFKAALNISLNGFICLCLCFVGLQIAKLC